MDGEWLRELGVAGFTLKEVAKRVPVEVVVEGELSPLGPSLEVKLLPR